MSIFGQQNRLLTFSCPSVGKDVLLPEHLSGTEGISELFSFHLDLLAAHDTVIDPNKIVAKKVTVSIQVNDSGVQRDINGYVSSFEAFGRDEELMRYRAHIVPSIWMLSLNKNTRVFQDKSVIQIINAVLSTYRISLNDKTSANHPALDYCTQYRETDLDFISRLMEQFGILYYFEHSKDDHKFTVQDKYISLDKCPVQDAFVYEPEGSQSKGPYSFVVTEIGLQNTMAPGLYTAWDYTFTGYSAYEDSFKMKTPLGENQNEIYDNSNSAAAYTKKTASIEGCQNLNKGINLIRAASVNSESALIAEGQSNAICLQSGYTASLSKHPNSNLNVKFLVTHVNHDVQQTPSFRTKSFPPVTPYSNSFVWVPFTVAYRPPFRTHKPVVNGMHTGKVVVPSGEDSHMDKYGRVCVEFWWDRKRKPNTVDNTLLRVAQSWAGKGWGTYYWPRVDDEVLIDFLEGDPDQPIVVGSVYNGVNMPKYDPAGQYTLAGILTRSSKDGSAANANELRFEDLKGKEQIFMNAERNYDLHVEHDWHTLVGNEQHTKVDSNQFEEVDGDSHLHVKGKQLHAIDGEADLNVTGNQIVQIGGDRSHWVGGNLKEVIGQNSNIAVGQNLNEQIGTTHSLQIGENQYSKIGMNVVVDSGMNVYIKGGMNVVIEGGMNVCLSGPGGFVSVGPTGVTISGTMVLINSGGADVPGSPGSPQSPDSPASPTAPTAPTFPGDDPPSKPASSGSS